MGSRQLVQPASSDLLYLQSSIISFADFNQEMEASKFEIEAYMKNFCPTLVDTERLFPISRIFNHRRNVYLRKNENLLREKERRLITIPYKKKQLIWYSRRNNEK